MRINLKTELVYGFKSLLNIGLVSIIAMLAIVGNKRNVNLTSFDLLLNSFIGPFSLASGALVVLAWIAYKTFIFYSVGNYFNIELNQRFIYTLPRIKSRTIWLLTRLLHIFILILLYNIICFIAIGAMNYLIIPNQLSVGFYTEVLIKQTGYSQLTLGTILIYMFVLLVLSMFLNALIQLLIVLVTKDTVIAFIVVEVLSIVSLISNSFLIRFLPEAQSIFIKHRLDGFSLTYSLGYTLVVILILALACIFYVRKNEL